MADPTAGTGPDVVASPDTRAALEALLLVAEEPVAPELLAQLLEIPAVTVDATCVALAEEFSAQGRGFTVAKVAGGWRFQTVPEQAPYVERFVVQGQSSRLSNAAMETLAIVAYRQPISRAQVASIRGVNVEGVMRSLHQRGYIDEVGRDAGPGQAVLFGTTAMFLDKLGLDSLDELPPLGQFVPDAAVVEALEAGLRMPAEPGPDAIVADEPPDGFAPLDLDADADADLATESD